MPSWFAKRLVLLLHFFSITLFLRVINYAWLEQLQQFSKSTWHPSNFGKTRKIGLQQFDKLTWQK
jgi:hypothetical protein